jgi:5,10-methylenetetrahydromethanopterin reductase
MQVSVAFAPSLATPEHILHAERLGFTRAWCYDGPPIWSDAWMALARAAEQTDHIGLGVAVLVPGYRHVMANAAAAATLAGIAPGRVAVAVGVGHGQRMMGARATPWDDVERYIEALRRLLGGGEIELAGSLATMLHGTGFVADRPAEIPILVAAQGPRGIDVARRLGDGVVSIMQPTSGFDWSVVVVTGTVLPADGQIDPDRLMEAAGAGAAVLYHTTYDLNWREPLSQIPGGEDWLAELESVAPDRRHLAAWSEHLVGLSAYDRAVLSPELVRQLTFTGTADELRERLAALGASGATEVVYQPTGPDIPGELNRFAEMAQLRLRT